MTNFQVSQEARARNIRQDFKHLVLNIEEYSDLQLVTVWSEWFMCEEPEEEFALMLQEAYPNI